MRVKINVTGIVQGVGFRPFVYRKAITYNLNGYIQNRGDAGVEILVEGASLDIDNFLNELKFNKPPLSKIFQITTNTLKGENQYKTFAILESTKKSQFSGSVIPPDCSICDECIREFRNSSNIRFNYFFITCVNCGPRYTLIENLPFDRKNTTMRKFHLCDNCKKEYEDSSNRRFHAQTIACSLCGPQAYLVSSKGNLIDCENPIWNAGKLLSKGNIIAIKGYGGFHIASSAIKDIPLIKLRKSKSRRAKPFAIMANHLDSIKSFAEINTKEEQLLCSPMKPIVLLNKSNQYNFSDLISPGLHTIGVMLPYSAMHHMLFDKVKDVAFVMTSANPPNQPIITDNDAAFKILGNIVDYFLIHNREIANKCDDSVILTHNKNNIFLRRSRGYAPAPVILKKESKNFVVSLGGELNNTTCVLNGNKAFVSQHIGDVENLETKNFLQEATYNMINLTKTKVDTIVCDLHPKFITTSLSKELANKNNWRLIQVQHHHAHLASLMAEYGVDEAVGIICDGYGYGTDGTAWGGEILYNKIGRDNFERLAHLEKQPLLGGDLATIYPLRLAAAILNKKTDVEPWLTRYHNHFPHGKKEVDLIIHQLKNGFSHIETTSLGRILDATAAILDLCYERTFEGEAAIKLESAAMNGKDVLGLSPSIKNNCLETTCLLLKIHENKNNFSKKDLSYSAHSYIAKGLAKLAVDSAIFCGVDIIGFSGGSAANKLLAAIIRKHVESAGLNFIVHNNIPPGDGGISLGQSVIGGFSNS